MKPIFKRLRRLEAAAAPYEQERSAADAIMEIRRRRLGADYQPIEYPAWLVRELSRYRGSHHPRPPVRKQSTCGGSSEARLRLAVKTKIARLERTAEIRGEANYRCPPPGLFEAMHISDADSKLLDEILNKGQPTTLAEQAAFDRFVAEYERAFDEGKNP